MSFLKLIWVAALRKALGSPFYNFDQSGLWVVFFKINQDEEGQQKAKKSRAEGAFEPIGAAFIEKRLGKKEGRQPKRLPPFIVLLLVYD